MARTQSFFASIQLKGTNHVFQDLLKSLGIPSDLVQTLGSFTFYFKFALINCMCLPHSAKFLHNLGQGSGTYSSLAPLKWLSLDLTNFGES